MTRMYRVTARRGRGECQEVRAPRTCPAVRMRQAPAPQGKSSALLLRPLVLRPSGKGRGRAGDRWSRGRRAESKGAGHPSAPPPSLKGQHLRAERASRWVGVSLYQWETEVQKWRRPASGQRARKGQELELATRTLRLGAEPSGAATFQHPTPGMAGLLASLSFSGQVPMSRCAWQAPQSQEMHRYRQRWYQADALGRC